MDELALLKDMADDTPLPFAGELAPARARLTAAMAVRADTVGAPAATAAGAEAAASGTRVATTPRRHRRRLAIFGVATVGLAAAITAVVALGGRHRAAAGQCRAGAAGRRRREGSA